MRSTIEVLCDFDGTISPVDTVDLLLERLADPAWRMLEEQWVRGEISSRECMAGQIPLLRGGWRAIEKILAGVTLAPSFASFASWCREARIPLRIVSEGLDRVIEHLLGRDGITVDQIWASHLREHAGRRLSLSFPETPRTAGCGAALCKCALFPAETPRPWRVLIGDGRSDFCCASRADLVFACSKLSVHCKQNDVPFVTFTGFDGVRQLLEQRLGAARRDEAVPRLGA